MAAPLCRTPCFVPVDSYWTVENAVRVGVVVGSHPFRDEGAKKMGDVTI